MRVPLPIVVSFSTSAPRPTTTFSAISTRSRTHDWSPTMQAAPILEPAKTIAPAEITVPPPTSVGGRGSRFAVDFAPSVGCLPTNAFSSTRTPSPSTVPGYTVAVGWTSAIAPLRHPRRGCLRHLAGSVEPMPAERRGKAVERADDARAVLGHLAAVALSPDQPQELLAFEPKRLGGVDLRDVDVAGARLPFPIRLGPLPRRLLVDGHLPLELHVVEDGHLLATDDGHLPHLVRVEPREMHVRDLPAREAQIAEHDILDAFGEEVAPMRDGFGRLLVEEIENDRQVVHAQRPERVLVRADDAEVLPVAVDAQHVAELAVVDQLLQLAHAGVVEQQMARHEHEVALRRERDELVDLRPAHGRGLLDEHVLAGFERLLRKRIVRGHRRRDHDTLHLVRGEQLLEGI